MILSLHSRFLEHLHKLPALDFYGMQKKSLRVCIFIRLKSVISELFREEFGSVDTTEEGEGGYKILSS